MQKILSYKDRIVETVQKNVEDQKLVHYTTKGKLIRGSLFLFGFEMWGGKITESELRIAAALELMHSGFLIHDDIMDRDLVRRGELSMHVQFQQEIEKNATSPTVADKSLHYGESLAICEGNIAFFLMMKLIAGVDSKITNYIVDVMLEVGKGQIGDIRNSFVEALPTQEEILNVFKLKTGHYTFALPLTIGAMMQSKPQSLIEIIQEMSDVMGVVFQIVDDQIGLFGTQEEIGKPVGSDVRENKKTLYRILLEQKATQEEKEKMNGIFGKSRITPEDIDWVKELVRKHDIDKEIKKLVGEYEIQAKEAISKLKNEVASEYTDELLSLLEYNSNRLK